MIRSLSFLLAVSGPAAAEAARVYSGEHGEFTRLVVELPAETQWTLGRTKEGYAFAVLQGAQPDYDLSSVWQRISRTRVSAVQVDPESGALLLSLACDCHVFPFEYRAGAIVLDVKPGQPPVGSAFEAQFAGASLQALGDDQIEADVSGTTYDWLTDLPSAYARRPAMPSLPLATGEVSLEPLHNALLEQIARGAADGMVDMGRALPKRAADGTVPEELPWSSVMLGELPGVRISDPDAFVPRTEPSSVCPSDELLDIATWGGDGSPLDLLAAARTGLFGEFDIADPEAMKRSIRSHLFLGFGAEAAQLADLANADGEDAVLALYKSMARAIDGDTDPGTPFAQLLDCDGPAALWAALSRDRLPAGKVVNREAILRSFLALPPHLRAQLGISLAEKFLALDDQDAARTIRDAMERTPNIDGAAVALLDAERELHMGNAEAAQAHAEEAVSLEGNRAEGLVALVEAHFQKFAPIGPEIADALMSGRGEVSGTELAAEVDRAIVLALALSGQIDAAFQHQSGLDDVLKDLWAVVQALASDDDFLRHAVLPESTLAPRVSADLSLQVSRRLLSLGFPDAAMSWVGSVGPNDVTDRRLVAAKVALDLGNARWAVELLEGMPGLEASEIRAQALLQLGDLTAAAEALSASGQTEAASRATLWEGEWSALDPMTPEIWKTAASLTQPVEAGAEIGLLGRGAQSVEASAISRQTIEALLSTVAKPEDDLAR
jgi:hypothetical protein